MRTSTWTVVLFLLYVFYDQTTGAFLEAISAALATIPFTGGPIAMTAGLAGVKLGVGSKLLYFLGYFGRRGRQAPKPSPEASPPGKQKPPSSIRIPFSQGYSAVPLPYMLRGGGGRPQLGMPEQRFPESYSSQFGSGGPEFSAGQLMPVYGGMHGGGQGQFLPNQFGGFPGAFGSQGISTQLEFPNSAVDSSNFPPSLHEIDEGNVVTKAGSSGTMPPQEMGMYQPTESDQMNEQPVSSSDADVDSFFSFLSEMDDNMCISRLICDIGVDPNFLGEFSQNINSIIGTLEVPPDTRAQHYLSVMNQGRQESGGCADRFNHCTDDAYELVKSVAPSVGVPSNLEDLNLF